MRMRNRSFNKKVLVHNVLINIVNSVLVFSIFLFLSGCDSSNNDKTIEPVKLIDGILSYQSMSDFLRTYPNAVLNEKEGGAESFKKEKIRIRSSTIFDFESFEKKGILYVHFFNNRLMSVLFYPSDINGYLINLKSKGYDLITISNVHIMNKVIRTGRDHKGNDYVGWEDKRLSDEFEVLVK